MKKEKEVVKCDIKSCEKEATKVIMDKNLNRKTLCPKCFVETMKEVIF
jgi:hypothetical protein